MLNTNLYVKPGQLRPFGLPRPAQKKVLTLARGLTTLAPKLFTHLAIHYFSVNDTDVCQNVAFILSRVLSARYNLPIARKMPTTVDHIEIAVGIYAPDDLSKAFHQTFLKVFIGGKAIYVDPLLSYLEEGKKEILFRVYDPTDFNKGLEKEFSIEPYHPDHRAYKKANILAHQYTDPIARMQYVDLALDHLHGSNLVSEKDDLLIAFNVTEWQRMDRVLKAIEPKAKLPPLQEQLEGVGEKYGAAHLLLLAP